MLPKDLSHTRSFAGSFTKRTTLAVLSHVLCNLLQGSRQGELAELSQVSARLGCLVGIFFMLLFFPGGLTCTSTIFCVMIRCWTDVKNSKCVVCVLSFLLFRSKHQIMFLPKRDTTGGSKKNRRKHRFAITVVAGFDYLFCSTHDLSTFFWNHTCAWSTWIVPYKFRGCPTLSCFSAHQYQSSIL